MNFGFQRYNIKRGFGIETEKFDFDAHIDRSLTYHENRDNIMRMTGQHKTRHSQARFDQHGRLRKTDTLGEYYQIGSSNKKRDELRTALPPGYRRGRKGGYVERRKNRSDYPGRRV